MGKNISAKFREAIKRSRFTYEQFARELGTGTTRQSVNDALSKRTDDTWKYADIVKWCRVLDISVSEVLESVDRKA